jgi:hypothetical protein
MSEEQLEQRQSGLMPVEIVSALVVFAVIVATGVLMSGSPIHF